MVTTIAFVVRGGWNERQNKRDFICRHYRGKKYPLPATTQSKFNPLQQARRCACTRLLPLLLLTGPSVSIRKPEMCQSVRYWLLQTHLLSAFILLFYLRSSFILHHGACTPHETLKVRSMHIALNERSQQADLREWRIGAVMYRWSLRHFPRGGSYADIHHATIEEAIYGLGGESGWQENGWRMKTSCASGFSMQKLATDPGERPFW